MNERESFREEGAWSEQEYQLLMFSEAEARKLPAALYARWAELRVEEEDRYNQSVRSARAQLEGVEPWDFS